MGMVFQITAEAFEVLTFHDEVDVIIPRNETAVTQRAENVSTIEAAGNIDFPGSILEIDGHVEEPQLSAAQCRSVGVIFLTEILIGFTRIVYSIFLHNFLE